MRRWIITTIATAVVGFIGRKIAERRGHDTGHRGKRRR
jgi:hypothetical protein